MQNLFPGENLTMKIIIVLNLMTLAGTASPRPGAPGCVRQVTCMALIGYCEIIASP